METCYKLFKADMVKGLALKENRFGFEPEVTAKIARIPKVRIYEVGISYYGRTFEEGKKIGWKDGFRALYCITKYGLSIGMFLKLFFVTLFLFIILSLAVYGMAEVVEHLFSYLCCGGCSGAESCSK